MSGSGREDPHDNGIGTAADATEERLGTGMRNVSRATGPVTRRIGLWLAVGALCLVTGAGVGWALALVLTPVDEVAESEPYTFVTVARGEVGSSIQLKAVAEWKPVPVGTNRAVGVVTAVHAASGDEVEQGSTLYSVNIRPVVVAQGEVPAFRSITLGAEGADVKQVQQMLTARGIYSGVLDGKVGGSTVAAIKRWQQEAGFAPTGVVESGDIIFVPSLPTRVSLDAAIIYRGATLSGGEEAVHAVPPAPTFSIPVTEAQAMLIPTETRVEMTSPDGATWVGFANTQTTEAATSTIIVDLAGADDTTICGDQCGQIPVIGQSLLDARIVTAETVSGLVVPSAALVSGADGEIAVVTEEGVRMPVTVVAAARGMSVVEGVHQGLRVRVPGGA